MHVIWLLMQFVEVDRNFVGQYRSAAPLRIDAGRQFNLWGHWCDVWQAESWMEAKSAEITRVAGEKSCIIEAAQKYFYADVTWLWIYSQPVRRTTCEFANRKNKCVCTHSRTFPVSLIRASKCGGTCRGNKCPHTFIHTHMCLLANTHTLKHGIDRTWRLWLM